MTIKVSTLREDLEALPEKWRKEAEAWPGAALAATLKHANELAALLAQHKEKPLFETGDFTLHAGGASSWRINCEVLTDADLDTIAGVMADRIGMVSGVEGVPTGGLRFAAALRKVVKLDAFSPVLIVDDVLTTGESMETHKGIRDAVGVVLFARGQCPSWIEPVWSFDVAQHAEPEVQAEQEQPECDGNGWLRRDPECDEAWRASPGRQLLHGDFTVCDCKACPGCPACRPDAPTPVAEQERLREALETLLSHIDNCFGCRERGICEEKSVFGAARAALASGQPQEGDLANSQAVEYGAYGSTQEPAT